MSPGRAERPPPLLQLEDAPLPRSPCTGVPQRQRGRHRLPSSDTFPGALAGDTGRERPGGEGRGLGSSPQSRLRSRSGRGGERPGASGSGGPGSPSGSPLGPAPGSRAHHPNSETPSFFRFSSSWCLGFLVHALVPALVPALIHSLIHSCTDSFIHSFIHSCTDSVIHSLTHSCTDSFILALTCSLTRSFMH